MRVCDALPDKRNLGLLGFIQHYHRSDPACVPMMRRTRNQHLVFFQITSWNSYEYQYQPQVHAMVWKYQRPQNALCTNDEDRVSQKSSPCILSNTKNTKPEFVQIPTANCNGVKRYWWKKPRFDLVLSLLSLILDKSVNSTLTLYWSICQTYGMSDWYIFPPFFPLVDLWDIGLMGGHLQDDLRAHD